MLPITAGDDTPAMKKFARACPEGRVEDGVTLQMAAAHKGPRILKTHLQLELLNPDLLNTSKVNRLVLRVDIYIERDVLYILTLDFIYLFAYCVCS